MKRFTEDTGVSQEDFEKAWIAICCFMMAFGVIILAILGAFE